MPKHNSPRIGMIVSPASLAPPIEPTLQQKTEAALSLSDFSQATAQKSTPSQALGRIEAGINLRRANIKARKKREAKRARK